MSFEAVKFRDWRPWHAVQPEPNEDRTFCGISVFGAKHMWETWDDKNDRCKQCAYVLRAKERNVRTHLKTDHGLNLDRPTTLEILHTIHSAQHAGDAKNE